MINCDGLAEALLAKLFPADFFLYDWHGNLVGRGSAETVEERVVIPIEKRGEVKTLRMVAREDPSMYIDITVSGEVIEGSTADFGVLKLTT